VQIAHTQSKCIHSAPAAADACIFVVTILREQILGIPNATIPRSLHSDADPDVARVAAGSHLALRDLNPTRHVVRTLETALWALQHTESFEQALIAATSLGGDADSIGAVTGMLAGSTYGLSAIPGRWLRRLAWRDEIIAIGNRLLETANA
jgi:ADP-ribosyl-[dinitrogen reductase] hydrolase